MVKTKPLILPLTEFLGNPPGSVALMKLFDLNYKCEYETINITINKFLRNTPRKRRVDETRRLILQMYKCEDETFKITINKFLRKHSRTCRVDKTSRLTV